MTDTVGNLEVHTVVHGASGREIVSVAGEVDLATAPVLEDHIIRRLAAGPSILVIDLTEVTFLGSSGLAVLVKARDQAGLRTLVRVVANSQVTLRPLRITALDRLLAVCPSVEHAVADPLDGPSQVRPAPARTADVVG